MLAFSSSLKNAIMGLSLVGIAYGQDTSHPLHFDLSTQPYELRTIEADGKALCCVAMWW
ncbi:MAG: hypothetical protein Q4B71_03775 [Cardiobacteriaceae bacterium]|nr:hypothetical protein [Cardiobacteriaceae bacterium]